MDDPSQVNGHLPNESHLPDEETLSTATPPKLTVLAGLSPASHHLRVGETVVGRSSDTDVRLAHPEVSRRHCLFRWDSASGCTVEDLGSHWGTKVNGIGLEKGEAIPLRPGDHLAIGPVIVFYGFAAPTSEEANLVLSSHGQRQGGKSQMLVGGKETDVIVLGAKRIALGRGNDMDVVLADAGVSRQHAAIEPTPDGYEVTDLRSRAGSLVNGRRFEKHQLVIGDQLQIGPFFFRFDGRALERTTDLHSVSIEAVNLRQSVPGGATILNDVSLRIERSQFVMILGPSGAGKSSLLETLIGLRPADSGQILYDGEDFSRDPEGLRALVGHVPQDDIVHRELTPVQALNYSARLRLPAGTPSLEINKLVAQTVTRLGLAHRLDTPIHRLSGGERKRVNVGVELLDRPAVLFLDEPTSGLDPAGEFKMMELLRHLADSGCTVICTTHVVENVYLADRLFVMTGGRLAFAGTAQEARAAFDVQKLTLLYDRLEDRTPAEWGEIFQSQQEAQGEREDINRSSFAAWQARERRPVERPPAALPVLLARQWTIMRADWKNFILLFGQPLIIALLVARVTDDAALAMFFAYLSTLWFGCSNAAQEIVREIAIYRRERMVGLGRHVYLLSKFALWGALTACQGLFLYACVWATRWYLYPDPGEGVARGIDGSLLWNLGAVVGTAFAAVGIGFAVSAVARTTMQAVMAVPLVLIPQILFSGLVVETNQMSSPFVYAMAQPMPSYAAQTMTDVGSFIGRPITGEIYNVHKKAGDHLKDLLLREYLAHPPKPDMGKGELRSLASSQFRIGETYRRADVGWIAAAKLLAWALAGYFAAWLALRARERA